MYVVPAWVVNSYQGTRGTYCRHSAYDHYIHKVQQMHSQLSKSDLLNTILASQKIRYSELK